MYRSTKGASKARRDQINAEIRNLKELLPISDADKARLSYLHIMSLACMYTRKSAFFSQEMAITARHEESGTGSLLSLGELSDVLNALPGFLLLISSEGKLLYLSDNVAEHLGHSMVDLVAQSDSVYDIVDPNDHFVLRSNLVPTTAADSDRLFRCRFNTSKFIRRQGAGSKLTLVRARCLSLPTSASSYWSSNPVWMCSCSPLEPRTPYPATPKNPLLTPPSDQSFFLACFHSRHARDMKFLEAHDSVSVYLGYDIETLRSRSWYSLLHPRDLSHASAKHCSLLREAGERRVEMVVQVEALGGAWVWLYMVLQLETGDQPISCLNYVISEAEALSVRQQLCLEQNQLALYLGASGGGAPYPEPLALSCFPSEPLSSPDQVFTPSSSGLSGQSFDFSLPTSSQSSSDELGCAGPPDTHLQHQQHHHHHLHQNHPTQQQPQHLFPQESLTLLGQRSGQTGPLQARLQAPAVSSPNRAPLPPLPPLAVPLPPPQQKEFVCTPPYTPRFGGTGNFLFGDEQFGFDCTSVTEVSANTVAGSMVPAATPGTTCAQPLNAASRGLPVPPTEAAARHKSRYGKLPLGANMVDLGVEYTTMALPEIRGPLYVDVPHGHYYPAVPEGLLTPDASPTKQPSFPPVFFPQDGRQAEEIERLEISLLAQYISAVAEGFYDNPLHPKQAPQSAPRPHVHPRPPHHHPVPTCQPPQTEALPVCELFPANMWATASDCQPVPQDISLFEESIVVDLSPQNSPSPPHPLTTTAILPSSSSSSSSSPMQYSPPAPETWSSPCQSQGAQSPIGEYHFSSVQSARANHPVGGGCLRASGLLVVEEEEGVALCGMDMEVVEAAAAAMLPTSQSSSIPSSPESTLPPPTTAVTAAALSAPAPGASCAQSLLEELVSMETVFGADALMASAVGQHPELYQLSHHRPQRGVYPDEASDHML